MMKTFMFYSCAFVFIGFCIIGSYGEAIEDLARKNQVVDQDEQENTQSMDSVERAFIEEHMKAMESDPSFDVIDLVCVQGFFVEALQATYRTSNEYPDMDTFLTYAENVTETDWCRPTIEGLILKDKWQNPIIYKWISKDAVEVIFENHIDNTKKLEILIFSSGKVVYEKSE